ncbi:type IV pili methyl-accepting chemotaxis transducer N-terminal domain-containing protein [Desulforhopalus sp. 52FAK]
MNGLLQMIIASLVISLVTVTGSTLAFAEGPTAGEYGVVLNLSGKQRMLSQKMSKEVALIKLNYKKDENLANLKATSALFDKTLKGLRDGDEGLKLPATESRRILRQIDQKITPLWGPFYATIQEITAAGDVTDEQLDAIAVNNLPLLGEMNKCVKLYEKDAAKAGMKSDPGLAVTINLAGKQRMLSQKMSKEFLLIAAGYKVDDNKLSLQETSGLFERTLTGLLDGDATLDLPGTKDEGIRAQLVKVQGLWTEFKPGVEFAAKSTDTIPEDKVAGLAEQNLPLLKEMNKAVGMYEALAAQ